MITSFVSLTILLVVAVCEDELHSVLSLDRHVRFDILPKVISTYAFDPNIFVLGQEDRKIICQRLTKCFQSSF